MVQSIQLNTCSSIFGDAENHDSSSEASNGNDEVLENENENDDDFDDEDADDKDVEEEEEEAEADSPAAFLSPAPRAVKVTAAAKKDQDQKAIANANAKGQGKYSIPVDSMLQSPFKKTWSRGNWTMEEDELLRAGGRLSLLSPCLSIYVSIHVCMWSCSRPPARREVLEEDIKSHRGPDGRAVSAPLAEGAAARAHQGALDPGGAPP